MRNFATLLSAKKTGAWRHFFAALRISPLDFSWFCDILFNGVI
jgi:hypothetical protein